MKTLYSEYAVDVQRRKAEQEDPAPLAEQIQGPLKPYEKSCDT